MIMPSSHPTQHERDLICFLFLLFGKPSFWLWTSEVWLYWACTSIFWETKGWWFGIYGEQFIEYSFVSFLSLMSSSLSFFYGPTLLIQKWLYILMQNLTLMVLLLQRVDTNFLSYAIGDTQKYPYIASMGVYVFKRYTLLNLLK